MMMMNWNEGKEGKTRKWIRGDGKPPRRAAPPSLQVQHNFQSSLLAIKNLALRHDRRAYTASAHGLGSLPPSGTLQVDIRQA